MSKHRLSPTNGAPQTKRGRLTKVDQKQSHHSTKRPKTWVKKLPAAINSAIAPCISAVPMLMPAPGALKNPAPTCVFKPFLQPRLKSLAHNGTEYCWFGSLCMDRANCPRVHEPYLHGGVDPSKATDAELLLATKYRIALEAAIASRYGDSKVVKPGDWRDSFAHDAGLLGADLGYKRECEERLSRFPSFLPRTDRASITRAGFMWASEVMHRRKPFDGDEEAIQRMSEQNEAVRQCEEKILVVKARQNKGQDISNERMTLCVADPGEIYSVDENGDKHDVTVEVGGVRSHDVDADALRRDVIRARLCDLVQFFNGQVSEENVEVLLASGGCDAPSLKPLTPQQMRSPEIWHRQLPMRNVRKTHAHRVFHI